MHDKLQQILSSLQQPPLTDVAVDQDLRQQWKWLILVSCGISWDNIARLGGSQKASVPSLGPGAGCQLWCLHSLCVLSLSMVSHPPGTRSSCDFSSQQDSLYIVAASQKQKQKLAGYLRYGLHCPRTPLPLHSIGQSRSQGQFDSGEIHPHLSTERVDMAKGCRLREAQFIGDHFKQFAMVILNVPLKIKLKFLFLRGVHLNQEDIASWS